MFGRTAQPETTPDAAHDRPDTQVLLDVREADEWATEALRKHGLDAINVTGGMNAWATAGLPVVRDDGQPGSVI